MAHDEKLELPAFPAMNELISRMSTNDLLILSGFISYLYNHTNDLVAATTALAPATGRRSNEWGYDSNHVRIIQHEGDTIRRSLMNISSKIMSALSVKSHVKQRDDKSNMQSGNHLQKALPKLQFKDE